MNRASLRVINLHDKSSFVLNAEVSFNGNKTYVKHIRDRYVLCRGIFTTLLLKFNNYGKLIKIQLYAPTYYNLNSFSHGLDHGLREHQDYLRNWKECYFYNYRGPWA